MAGQSQCGLNEHLTSLIFRFLCGFQVSVAFAELKNKLKRKIFFKDLIITIIMLVWLGLRIRNHLLRGVCGG